MRGKGGFLFHVVFQLGITPACAGKRDHVSIMLKAFGDHPRMCGEKGAEKASSTAIGGLPPRMRGKVLAGTGLCSRHGITPAYAGKSAARHRPCAESKDHPRVCGEKSQCIGTHTARKGSPPRMRGKVSALPAASMVYRITPAYAGKSRCCSRRAACGSDHPRTCGEKKPCSVAL